MDNLTRELLADAFTSYGEEIVAERREHHAEIAELIERGEFGERMIDFLADALAAKDLSLKVIDK